MIVGVGVDMVETSRIERALERHGERFLARIFTAGEAEYCRRMKNRTQHLAARFAAKEAAAKALGTGVAQGVAFRQIEVVKDPHGKPLLEFHGEAARRAESLGVRAAHVSLTHVGSMAAAVAVLEGDGPPAVNVVRKGGGEAAASATADSP